MPSRSRLAVALCPGSTKDQRPLAPAAVDLVVDCAWRRSTDLVARLRNSPHLAAVATSGLALHGNLTTAAHSSVLRLVHAILGVPAPVGAGRTDSQDLMSHRVLASCARMVDERLTQQGQRPGLIAREDEGDPRSGSRGDAVA